MCTPIAAIFAKPPGVETHTPVAPFQTLAPDVELGQRPDQHLFDAADVGDHIALPFSQIEDGVSDHLAGTVIGHIAAAIGVMEFDAGASQKFGVGQNVFLVRVAAHGDHGRMFDESEADRESRRVCGAPPTSAGARTPRRIPSGRDRADLSDAGGLLSVIDINRQSVDGVEGLAHGLIKGRVRVDGMHQRLDGGFGFHGQHAFADQLERLGTDDVDAQDFAVLFPRRRS